MDTAAAARANIPRRLGLSAADIGSMAAQSKPSGSSASAAAAAASRQSTESLAPGERDEPPSEEDDKSLSAREPRDIFSDSDDEIMGGEEKGADEEKNASIRERIARRMERLHEEKDSSDDDSDVLSPITEQNKKTSKRKKGSKGPRKARKKQSGSAKTKDGAPTPKDGAPKRGKNFDKHSKTMLAKAYMKTSQDATVGVDQTEGTFWEKVAESFNSMVEMYNSTRAKSEYFVPQLNRTASALKSQWNARMQPAINKFAAIVEQVPPASGEQKDDAHMNLYYARIKVLYAERVACAHLEGNGKNLQRDFGDLFESYMFLKDQPKFSQTFGSEVVAKSAKKKRNKEPKQSAQRPAGRDTEKRKKVSRGIFDYDSTWGLGTNTSLAEKV